jgi:arabinofuranan 3-O-arabinosyltransferase
VMRAIVGRPFGWMLALAIPMALNNALDGQNGFLTAALIGGTLYLMPARPILAGICLGLLSYKPQYGLLFPLVLIAASQWRTFFSAAVTTVLMAFVSWLAFGIESWQAFFHWMPVFSQTFLVEGKAPWWKLQSLFSLLRFLGGTEQLAWIFQWTLTATVAVVLAVMWRSRVSYSLKAAALATGTLLITPYLFMYDMVVLAIPVAFLVRIGLRSGFRPYELPALGCAAALIFSFILFGAPVGLGSTLIVATLIMRRAAPWRLESVPSLMPAPTT